MDLKEADGIFRILWENYNSLQILIDSIILQKMRSLDEHRKRYKANLIAGCEAQTNWYQVPDGQRFKDIVDLGEHTRCTADHNIHNKTRHVNLVELLLQPLDKHLDMIWKWTRTRLA